MIVPAFSQVWNRVNDGADRARAWKARILMRAL